MDEAGIAALLYDEHGPVGQDLLRRVLAVEARVVEFTPAETGRARGSVDHEIGRDADGLYGRVGSNLDYFIHIERGTGLFEEEIEGVPASASKGHRITASDKQALAFEVHGQRVVVHSIKGMRAHAPLRRGLDAFDD